MVAKQSQHVSAEIGQVREFNRYYTRKIGVLQERLVDSEFSLTEVRILFELANGGAMTSGQIIAALELDAGYLSRILRKFEEKRLIRRVANPNDARQSLISLSREGAKAFSVLNERSSEHVANMISRLTVEQRRRLVSAMSEIKSLLDPENANGKGEHEIVLRTHEPGDIGWIIHRHGVLYAQEYAWDVNFEMLVAQIALKFLREFDPRFERCWIAENKGERVGTVMCVKGDTPGEAKLRLLLVEPTARGLGVGRRLVAECIRFARKCGYRKLVLWTNDVLTSARKIYEREGFKLVKEEAHHSFGHDLVGQYWELDL